MRGGFGRKMGASDEAARGHALQLRANKVSKRWPADQGGRHAFNKATLSAVNEKFLECIKKLALGMTAV